MTELKSSLINPNGLNQLIALKIASNPSKEPELSSGASKPKPELAA